LSSETMGGQFAQGDRLRSAADNSAAGEINAARITAAARLLGECRKTQEMWRFVVGELGSTAFIRSQKRAKKREVPHN
jgi:hypothetical protein